MHARHHTDVTPYVTPPHLTSHLGNNQTGDLRESLAAAEARLVAAEEDLGSREIESLRRGAVDGEE